MEPFRKKGTLLYHLESPPFADSNGSAGTEFLTAKTANAVTIPYFQSFPDHTDCFLGAVGLANAALGTSSVVDHRFGGKRFFEYAPEPLRKRPFGVHLLRETEVFNCHARRGLTSYHDVVQVRVSDS